MDRGSTAVMPAGASHVGRYPTGVICPVRLDGAGRGLFSWANEARNLGYGMPSPDGEHVAIVEADQVTELSTGGYSVSPVAISPDGRRIAGCVSDRTVRLWDAASGKVTDILRGHTDLVMDVAFSPDGNELASASYDR